MLRRGLASSSLGLQTRRRVPATALGGASGGADSPFATTRPSPFATTRPSPFATTRPSPFATTRPSPFATSVVSSSLLFPPFSGASRRFMSSGTGGGALPMTTAANNVLIEAQSLAVQHSSSNISTLHLIAALAAGGGDNYLGRLLTRMKGPEAQKKLKEAAGRHLAGLPKARPPVPATSLHITDELRNILFAADAARRGQGDNFIAVDHLIAAAVHDPTVARIFNEVGLQKAPLLDAIKEARGGKKVTSEDTEATVAPPPGQFEHLPQYGLDLLAEARAGRIDPVIGRDSELRQMMMILQRRQKNNPILLGPPGTGKTALAGALALRIVAGDVPASLKDCQLWTLDMGALTAGTGIHGSFEKRVQDILKEVESAHGKIILFVDEAHLLVSAGAGGREGGLNASNLLKPMLARGQLKMVAATTLDEYRRYLEKDEALTRRLQPITVEEPDDAATLAILRGLKRRYEAHHSVRIEDASLVLASRLSRRYISSRKNPDSSIDLIDQAAASIRVQLDSRPEAIDRLERKKLQLQIEKTALESETDLQSKSRLRKVREELSHVEEQLRGLELKYKSEKGRTKAVDALRKRIDELTRELEAAQQAVDLEKAARIQYGSLPAAQGELAELEKGTGAGAVPVIAAGGDSRGKGKEGKAAPVLDPDLQEASLLTDVVTPEAVAQVVSGWTGIPVSKLTSSETQKVLHLDERLRQKVIGQSEAVSAVAEAIMRSRTGLSAPGRPSSFLFLGSTGTGKTLLAKALAEELFNDDKAMVRIDCSEYQESHSISRLIGSPPGYVGFEQSGQLVEAVRRKPFSVILFDELEKAHKSVLQILLQILDDGRCTSGDGKVVSFKEAIVIMTSNLGAQALVEGAAASSSSSPSAKGDGGKSNLPFKLQVNEATGDVDFTPTAAGRIPPPSSSTTTGDHNEGVDEEQPISEHTKEEVMRALKGFLPPELLNRFDNIVFFNTLGRKQLKGICRNLVSEIAKRVEERNISLKADDDALQVVIAEAFDPAYGARPLRRWLDKHLATELSRLILSGKLSDNSDVSIRALKPESLETEKPTDLDPASSSKAKDGGGDEEEEEGAVVDRTRYFEITITRKKKEAGEEEEEEDVKAGSGSPSAAATSAKAASAKPKPDDGDGSSGRRESGSGPDGAGRKKKSQLM